MGHGVLRNGDDNVFFQRGDVNKNHVLIFIHVGTTYIHVVCTIFFSCSFLRACLYLYLLF